MSSSTTKYEPIPDVEPDVITKAEQEEQQNKKKEENNDYTGMDSQQMELLSSFDSMIQSNSKSFTFQLPSTNPNDMITQGQSFVSSLITPTITAIGTTVLAFIISTIHSISLSTESYSESISNVLLLLFPYMNATTMFISSYIPIQDRCVSSFDPILHKVQDISKQIHDSVNDITTNIHTSCDTIQTQVKTTIEPILPTLQMATQYETMLRTVQPTIDIPDASDIDEEFQNARSIIDTPIETIQTNIVSSISTKMIPIPFQSKHNFYYYIIIPIAICSYIVQLLVVYYTTTNSQTTTTSPTNITIPSSPWNTTTTTDISNSITNHWNDTMTSSSSSSSFLRGGGNDHTKVPLLLSIFQNNNDETHKTMMDDVSNINDMEQEKNIY